MAWNSEEYRKLRDNVWANRHEARFMHQFLQSEYEYLKEKLVETGKEEFRGRAIEVKSLLRLLENEPLKLDKVID